MSGTSTPRPTENPKQPASSMRPLHRPCKGECVSGLFSLFCDEVDLDATCPGGDDSCCITNPVEPARQYSHLSQLCSALVSLHFRVQVPKPQQT